MLYNVQCENINLAVPAVGTLEQQQSPLNNPNKTENLCT